ncbi:MAG: D-alanine--D-alanine ligase family protein, partial [Vicinamibacteria bacterium]
MSPAHAILFGGDGSERRVSVASAQNVASLLEGASLWFWRPDGTVASVARPELLAFERPFERDFSPETARFWPALEPALDSSEVRGLTFFLALHGGSGEDGTVQALLEERALAFTGSGAEASRLAFDKLAARERVAARGIRVAEASTVTADAATHERLARLFEIHEKIVVKPVADGSSHGIRVVANERELDAAIVHVVAHPEIRHLAEAFIEGRELTVGVIEEEDGLKALPCSEVVLEAGRTFDFDGKYLGKGVREITPADVSDAIAHAAQSVALAAHQAVGCRGYSRTDVIMGKEGPVFLEINTLPGLTRASFIPQQLEAAGIDMLRFLERQIEITICRKVSK